jgi:diketogulonate reductase-like aldo/keto reductase
METLFRVPNGDRCATNQVPYSLNYRAIERDLLSWCQQHNLPVMAYSPLGGDNNLVIRDRTLAQIGAAHGSSAAAVALHGSSATATLLQFPSPAFRLTLRRTPGRFSLILTPQDIQKLDAAFPGPYDWRAR